MHHDRPANFHDTLAFSRDADGRPLALAPASKARLFVLDLPARSAAQRVKAAAYAAEPRLGQAVEDIHVAVGPRIEAGRYLCAAAAHADMRAWLDAMAEAGEAGADLIPALCALPRPEAGAWTVSETGGEALVRTAEGEGFACSTDALEALTQARDAPTVARTGASPVPDLPVSLRTGPYKTPNRASARLRPVAAATCVAVLASLGLLLAEVVMLGQVREDRMEAARTRLAEVYDADRAAALSADPVAALQRLAASDDPPEASALDRVLSRVSAVLAASEAAPTVLALSYEGGAVTLALETAGLAQLQALQRAFSEAGLVVETGPVSQTAGRAEADLTLSPGAQS